MLRRGSTKSKGKGKGKGAREALRDLSSGEGGLQLRSAPMGADAAAAAVAAVKIWSGEGSASEDEAAVGRKAGKARPMSKPSNKLIVAGDYSKAGKAAAAAPAAKVAAGVAEGEGEKDVPPAVDADPVVKEQAPRRRTKLPQECVDWILAQKRNFVDEDPDEYYDRMINDPDRHEIYTQQFIEEETQLLRDMAAFYERSADRLEKFQRWVRRQLDTKGYVEIEDVYLDQAINYRESLRKLCDAMNHVPGFIYDVPDAVKQLAKQQAMEVPGLIYDRDDEELENQLAGGVAVGAN